MSEKEFFPILDANQGLFETASFGNLEAIVELTGKINMAINSKAPWPSDLKQAFESGLNKVAERFNPADLQTVECKLLKAAKDATLDSPILRDRYSALAKRDFPQYKDPASLCNSLGLRTASVSMEDVNTRWSMLKQIKANAYCLDKALELGTILNLDDVTSEVVILFDKRRSIPLQRFFEDYAVIADLSPLYNVLKSRQAPARNDSDDMKLKLTKCILHTCALPADSLHKLLVPAYMTEAVYKTQILNETPAPAKETAPAAAPAAAPRNTATARWDESRTVLELAERLKPLSSLDLDTAPNKANILHVFQFSASRIEHAENFALAFAYLDSLAQNDMANWVNDLATELADQAVIWSNIDRCIEISDKLPGKSALNWFHVISMAKGLDYLCKIITKLPFRLWAHAEKILAAQKGTDVLINTIIAELAAGHVTTDLLLWVWKSKQAAILPLKDKYLGNADFLFKTLQRPVKGSYLKAQREMKRMLMEDPEFQEQAMRHGEKNAVQELLRCVRRMPLLAPGEKQSTLVKISTLYPQYMSDIEEKQTTPKFAAIGNITSTRSYKAREAELEHLINVLIPENNDAIARAKEMGDLRENSEFKFAKERQQFLNHRRREWEESLSTLSHTNFANVKVEDQVIPGCTVTFAYLNDDGTLSDTKNTIHILGILDTDADRNIITFESPQGKALLNHKVNEIVPMPNGKNAKILTISELSPEMKKYVAGE